MPQTPVIDPRYLVGPNPYDPAEELRKILYKFEPEPRAGFSLAPKANIYPVTPPGTQPYAAPELNPIERYKSSMERFKERKPPSGSFESYSRQTETTLQGGKRATEALIQELEAQRARELANSVRRTSTGQLTSVYGAQAPSNPTGNIALGQRIAARHGITGQEWNALYDLGMKESGWRNTAQNPTSSAYGIGQFLDGTWSGVGGRKTSDAALQIEYMIRYINQRYGSPSRALAAWHSRSPHWY